ncbi:MAG: DUF2309 domain-containing protein [Candidatus Thiodiazotropha sp. (ex Ctena orbiculata)]|nr:DUF2309 domain-containing protein [Candidatus Thiodiazotropha taylori]MBT2996186.1 DUF2309 domain-containing protein [Candidatus Thiodiazotropha taylori]MBT2999669.1 DUF2309 domain-containing protein [Candidatus Thiodiazotropha taylori]MBV2106313.1 DUF2309 domain-containing protein [Candidatus Thiodiazotropha taylori]MBV2110445.1 DUF2309 domain-containing protein [Candidatus Thiodiazotropha taylori]
MGKRFLQYDIDAVRERLAEAIQHFEHTLPAQAPIKDFVHHNTLHGFEHMTFPEAVAKAERITGNHGYETPERFREYYAAGRICRADLEGVLDQEESLQAGEELFAVGDRRFSRRDIYIASLIHPLKPVTGCQLNWQMEAQDVLNRFQPDISDESRNILLQAAAADGRNSEASAINDLWHASLEALGLEHFLVHPEDLLDLTPERAEMLLSRTVDDEAQAEATLGHQRIRKESVHLLADLFKRVGGDLTLSGLLRTLTGHDLLDDFRSLLIRQLGNHLDQGQAAWHDRGDDGFYAAWRRNAVRDLGWLFDEMSAAREDIEVLPEDSLETIITELHLLGLDEAYWTSYLEQLALELPGWSGMFLWRHLNPGYEGLDQIKVDMTDYLAVRLILERLFAQRLCAGQWNIEPNLDTLRWYFRHRRSEFYVRHNLFNARMPEYLTHRAQRLVDHSPLEGEEYHQWETLADMVWTWRQSPAAEKPGEHSVYRSGWRLFRLAQHLGLSGPQLRSLDSKQVEAVFACIDGLDTNQRGFIWLRAYENNYRDRILNALVNNHGRGTWRSRETRPEAQIVFCMDDREEGIRRHLEELNPGIETFGAAAHFNVFNFFHGLDSDRPTILCPVVAVPTHDVHERPQPGQESLNREHQKRRSLRLRIKEWFVQETRRNLLGSTLLVMLAAPAAALVLAGKQLAPLTSGRLTNKLRRWFDRDEVDTIIEFTAPRPKANATPELPQSGFTDEEQADRLEAFLRNIGLVSGFSPLPVIMGHGSHSQNNPHMAAYSCGACSGRNSGPNARLLAAIGNRPEVRDILRGRDIDIPDDSWFLAAEHDTCNENINWYDLDLVPVALRSRAEKLRVEIADATLSSAHERARKFVSAPRKPTRKKAFDHIAGRALDFSQARPELGHATNACALIGRRAVTQGAFFDRRMFLISYDHTTDPEGLVLERLLLANGPVGAGINLEYYFSTVNNEGYGSGTKITHNVTGLLGVMEGASSDLRTGLPKQMIEVHEAMRLLVIVEAKTDMLTTIYTRQPPLQELVGNGWLLLAAKDPDSERIDLFDPARGWVEWQGAVTPLPRVARSTDWYDGHIDPLDPALIESGEVGDGA